MFVHAVAIHTFVAIHFLVCFIELDSLHMSLPAPLSLHCSLLKYLLTKIYIASYNYMRSIIVEIVSTLYKAILRTVLRKVQFNGTLLNKNNLSTKDNEMLHDLRTTPGNLFQLKPN